MSELPPGQYEIDEMPRFGLAHFATRFPTDPESTRLTVGGDVTTSLDIGNELRTLSRVHQRSDFHCVTAWSKRGIDWSGFLFADFYKRLVVPRAEPVTGAACVVLRCQDGYRASLPLEDLLAGDCLLATHMNGSPLTVRHGAPLRLVAPAHYGYKNPKHITTIEFWTDYRNYKSAGPRFMDHPQARVAHEERGRYIPGVILRWLYRPFVNATIRNFSRHLDRYLEADDR